MNTRMEKYYDKQNTKKNSRSARNKELYSDIYTYSKYSNIEGIAEINNSNKIDLSQVQELLKAKDNYKRKRQYKNEPEEKQEIKKRRYPEIEEKNYDIRDVLKQAREKKSPDDKERRLRNTEYNILKNIDLQKELKKDTYKEIEDNDDELKDLIQTITNTSMLNKIGDAQLAADLLSDLKDDDTQVGQIKNVREIMEEKPINENDYDKSFFTSSLNLNKSDFITDGEKPKSRIMLMVIIGLILLVLVAVLLVKIF